MLIEQLETDIVFLDTSIFEKENFVRGYKLKELGKLANENEIKLKITDITYNELKNRILENIIETKSIFKKFDAELQGKGKILKLLTEYSAYYPIKKVEAEPETSRIIALLDKFIQDNNIEIVNSSIAKVQDVFTRYFNLHPPFSEGKKKSEFPDAFTLDTIKEWCKLNRKKAFVISIDSDFYNYDPNSIYIFQVDDIASFLERIISIRAENTRFERIKNLIPESGPELEAYFERKQHDDLAVEIYQVLLSDPMLEDLDYEPPSNLSLTITNNLITEIEDIEYYVEIKAEIVFKMVLNFTDLSGAQYDREDGRWYNTEYISEQRDFKANVKFLVTYEYSEDDDSILVSEISDFELIDFEDSKMQEEY